jgi:hypothetical protein
MLPISTWLYGPGHIIKQGPTPSGGWLILADFPGYGRRFVEPKHLAHSIFSNN